MVQQDDNSTAPRRGHPGRYALLLALAGCFALTTAPLTAAAQDPAVPSPEVAPFDHRHPAGRPGLVDPERMLERLSDELELSDAQRESARAVVDRFRGSHADALARMKELRGAIRAAHEGGAGPSREDLEALARQYGNPGQELGPALRQLKDDLQSLLTPEQRGQLEDLKAHWREELRSKGRGQAPPPPG